MSFYDVLPARPASEVEWEDLLVRYELAPRALRVALDDGELSGPARTRVADLLRALVVNELLVSSLFAAMRDGRPAEERPRVERMDDDVRGIFDRVAALRDRNFAAVQRRGIDVWEWRTVAPGGLGPVTAHQLVLASVALDGETLAGVREALRGAGAC